MYYNDPINYDLVYKFGDGGSGDSGSDSDSDGLGGDSDFGGYSDVGDLGLGIDTDLGYSDAGYSDLSDLGIDTDFGDTTDIGDYGIANDNDPQYADTHTYTADQVESGLDENQIAQDTNAIGLMDEDVQNTYTDDFFSQNAIQDEGVGWDTPPEGSLHPADPDNFTGEAWTDLPPFDTNYSSTSYSDYVNAVNTQHAKQEEKVNTDVPAFDRLKWNKDVYHRWRQVFGPIEKNVADFYLYATPNTYLKPIKNAIQKSVKTLHSSIDYYDKLKQSELENIAAIGLNDKIANDKFNYFAQGMNLQSPLISGVNQASNALDQTNRNIDSLRMQQQINTNNNIAGLLGAGAMILGRN